MDTPQEISAFFDAIYEHLEQKRDHNIQSKDIQKFEEELDISRISCKNVNKNLSQNLKNDEYNISAKYVVLQERDNYYLKNIKVLEEKLAQIKMGVEQEKSKMAAEAELSLKREEKLWKKKIEEVNAQKQKRKLDHAKKKEKLNSDLTSAQLTNDLELDEIQNKLRKELVDLNGRIWCQNEIVADMKKQIEELKKQKKTSTTNIYQEDPKSLMDDIEEFFNDNGRNFINPQQQSSTSAASNALQKPNKHNFATDKNIARTYNSNYQPLEINKHIPINYNNNLQILAENVIRDNVNQSDVIHNNIFDKDNNYANMNNILPKPAYIQSVQENPTIIATTNNKQGNFNSNRNMSNPVQFNSSQTNKLDENRTMQNQSSNQQTLKQCPDFHNLNLVEPEIKTLPIRVVTRKSSSENDKGQKKNTGSNKRNSNQGPVQAKNKNINDGTTGVARNKQIKKKGSKGVENGENIDEKVLKKKPAPKKRKLFDPNNYDYLDEMMAIYAKDE